ncbi:MAG: peptidylprolyl isomerase [Patescibacteria group bacterium]
MKYVIAAAIVLIVAIAAILLVRGGQEIQTSPPPRTETPVPPPAAASDKPKNGMQVVTIETTFGAITFETFDADAPKTVSNFITLAEKGFYNGLTFHRVVAGFMIQGGDPKGDGTGGPGYSFEDELNPNTESYRAGYKKGVVAMANAGPNTNGSQFFIMLADTPLPHAYTIFGRIVSGQDAVDALGRVKTGPGDRPLESVVMTSVAVGRVSP